MKPRLLYGSLVLASVLALAGNALHPREADETKPIPSATASLMRDHHSQWLMAHGILLAMVPLMVLGYFGLFLYLRERKEMNYSLIGFFLIAVWGILSLMVFSLDGFMGPILAKQYSSSFDYNYYLSLVLTAISFVFYGLAILAFSVSAIRAKSFKWLVFAGLAISLVGLIGYPLNLFGVYWVYSSIFPFWAALSTVWSLAIGIALWRQA